MTGLGEWVRVETAQIVHLLTRLCGFTCISSQLIGITKGESIAGRCKWGWKRGIKGRWVVFIEADVSRRFVCAETCRQLPYCNRAPFHFFIPCFPRLQFLTRCSVQVTMQTISEKATSDRVIKGGFEHPYIYQDRPPKISECDSMILSTPSFHL